MHPEIQYEIAKMRVDEFRREADRGRLVRRTKAEPAVEWTGLLARLRARMLGGSRASDARRADAGT